MPTSIPKAPTTHLLSIPNQNESVKVVPTGRTTRVRVKSFGAIALGFENPGNVEGAALTVKTDLEMNVWFEFNWNPGAAPGTGFFLEVLASAPDFVEIVAD